MNIANLTTILRIVLIPVIVGYYYSNLAQGHLIAAAVFAVASLTDWLDGYLARKLDQATELGAFLDPVADKLLVVVVSLVLLATYPVLLLLPIAVIVVRELVISALREWTAARGKRVAVAFSGKLKATIQMLAIIALLTLENGEPRLLWLLGAGLIYLSA
ncbi:MAG: CDP-diacylglycerol--glycerol-3-phosphate 3-phosphatidyltransferase, partial [Gammaproteobacteria bacterium]|nr:CDP-diacylglycerol--glycerol-3-phosphate 3-phosphatidyltransferase [Gammaproteobacteria bacterium]